jgi:hypothetical protein
MKKISYAICFICLLWISFAIHLKYTESQKILSIEKKNSSCRYLNVKKGLLMMYSNCVALRKINDIETTIKFNSAGIPSPELKKKDEKTLRICFLAGSNMVGLGIKEVYFPQAVLQEEFEKALGRKVEFVNVAIEGFTTAQHAIAFHIFFRIYKPDVVIAYTANGYKVFRDALLYTYTQKNPEGKFQKLMPLHLTDFYHRLTLKYSAFSFSRQILRTVTENISLIKLENDLNRLKDNRDEQERLLFSPTVDYFNGIKNIMKYANVDRKFYAVMDNADIENIHSHHLYQLDTIDFIFQSFHPKISLPNSRYRSYLQKSMIETIDSDAVFTPEDYFIDTIYFNKTGMQKFAKNLAQNFAKSYFKKQIIK